VLRAGDHFEAEELRRKRVLRDLLNHLGRVRAQRPEWYVWATEGQPILSEERYEAVRCQRRGGKASSR
jgi:hypothetical protein